jgi:hypothetical protein
MTGGRFEGNIGMPVEALAELVAYHELVVGVAKEVFRSSHPNRQRLPRGFTDRLQLRLQSVEQGSAIPVLERVRESGALLAVTDEFTQSRDIIEDAVAAIAGGRTLPSSFPPDALVLFNRFGQTLRPDEAIELRRGTATSGPRYTRDVRRQLVLERGSTYQDEVRDIGWVWEIDANRMSCNIRLRLGPSAPVAAPLDEVTFEPLWKALAPNGNGPPVRILGVGVFDTTRGLMRLDSIHDVSPVDDPDDLAALDNRLGELEELQEGWLDGDGLPPAPAALQSARATLAELLGLEAPRPRVYPTPEGGVQAEWTAGNHEISLTFQPDGTLYAVAVNSESGEADELPDGDTVRIAQFVLRSP